MLGQTNRKIRAARFPQKLRRAQTQAELALWSHLRARQLMGFKFRRQHPFGNYILDLVCLEAKLVIEIDGSQHLDTAANDRHRDMRLTTAGFRVLRIWANDVLKKTPAVLGSIELALTSTAAPPSSHPSP
jgi:very-short-patch-repair endonuclease